MENFINWLDVKGHRGRSASVVLDLGIRIYTNSRDSKKNKGDGKVISNAYVIFSDFLSEMYQDYKYIKVGLINKKVVFKFNNEEGINICKTRSKMKFSTLRVNNGEFCRLISNSFNMDYNDFKDVLELTDLGGDTFLINSVYK
jgi:hypothetical protein